MPWDARSIRKKNSKLTRATAPAAARQANAILRETGDEGLALRTMNARVADGRAADGRYRSVRAAWKGRSD